MTTRIAGGHDSLSTRSGGLNRLIYRVPGPVRHLCSALGPGHDWAHAIPPDPAVFLSVLSSLAPAVAVQQLAAASVFALPVPAAEELACPALFFERVLHHAAVAASLVPKEPPVDAELHVESPAFLLAGLPVFSPEALPVFPLVQRRVLDALTAESVGEQPFHAAGNCIAWCEAPAAVQPVDTYLSNTAVGRQAAGRVSAQNRGSNGPIRFGAVPSRVPSADPSEAAHSAASL